MAPPYHHQPRPRHPVSKNLESRTWMSTVEHSKRNLGLHVDSFVNTIFYAFLAQMFSTVNELPLNGRARPTYTLMPRVCVPARARAVQPAQPNPTHREVYSPRCALAHLFL